MNMGKLKNPPRELAMRVLTEVDFEHRFNGVILRERVGAVPITLYSFEEIGSFLNDRHPRLDFEQLEKWIRSVMVDTELAEQIAEAIAKGKSDQNRSDRIRKLMEDRLSQCKKIFAKAESLARTM
jgi:hypothetical protein